MIARMQKSMKEKDQGFTLIELLVVMIIIGILSAIAIPVFLNQRKKAVDTAAKADVSTIGKEVATYFVDGASTALPTLAVTSGRYYLAGNDIGKQSDKMGAVAISTSPAAAVDKSTTWCVQLSYTGGTASAGVVSYSATNGLAQVACP